MATDTLSDEQLFALLDEAEGRLKSNEVCSTQTSVSNLIMYVPSQRWRFPTNTSQPSFSCLVQVSDAMSAFQ